MANINERAASAIEPALGTREEPKVNLISYGEGLQLAVNLIRADSGVKGFDTCAEVGLRAACSTCQIIGHKICELVEADKLESVRPQILRNT